MFLNFLVGFDSPLVPESESIFLARLELQANNFTQSLPPEIFGLSALQDLYLDKNSKLGGVMPTDIAKLTQLERLRLGETQIGGPLPAEFFGMVTLIDFVVPQCGFSGFMDPSQWGKLSNLEELDISFNKFEGPVPPIFVNNLTRLGKERVFFLFG